MILRGALGSCLVLLGGVITSAVPESSWVSGLEPLNALRGGMPGRMFGLVVVVIGLGVVAATWLELLRSVVPSGAADAGSRLSLVRRSTAAWCAPLVVAPPLFSRDGWSYAAQGVMTQLGASPYDWGPAVLSGPIIEAVDPRWLHTPTPYGPLPLLWGAAFAELTNGPWALVVAHRLLALLGLLLLAYATPRVASWTGRDPAFVSALVLPSPLMLAHGVGGLHNDLVMVGLMMLSLVVAVERSWVVAAVLGGAAAAVKLPGGLVCIGVALVSLSLVSWQMRVRRLVAVASVAVATLVGIGVIAGVGTGWVQALGVPGSVRTPLSGTTQLGQLVETALRALGSETAAAGAVPVLRGVGALLALGLACWTALRAPTGSPRATVHAVAVVMSAAVLLSPVVHHWYALWVVPIAAACALNRRALNVVVCVSVVLGLVAPLDSSLEGAYVAIVVTTVLVAGVVVALYLGHRADDRTLSPSLRRAQEG